METLPILLQRRSYHCMQYNLPSFDDQWRCMSIKSEAFATLDVWRIGTRIFELFPFFRGELSSGVSAIFHWRDSDNEDWKVDRGSKEGACPSRVDCGVWWSFVSSQAGSGTEPQPQKLAFWYRFWSEVWGSEAYFTTSLKEFRLIMKSLQNSRSYKKSNKSACFDPNAINRR